MVSTDFPIAGSSVFLLSFRKVSLISGKLLFLAKRDTVRNIVRW